MPCNCSGIRMKACSCKAIRYPLKKESTQNLVLFANDGFFSERIHACAKDKAKTMRGYVMGMLEGLYNKCAAYNLRIESIVSEATSNNVTSDPSRLRTDR